MDVGPPEWAGALSRAQEGPWTLGSTGTLARAKRAVGGTCSAGEDPRYSELAIYGPTTYPTARFARARVPADPRARGLGQLCTLKIVYK